MKTKQAAPKDTKAPGKSIAIWDEKLKIRAAAAAAAERKSVAGAGLKRLRVDNARLYLEDQLVKDDSVDVIVVASVHHNTFYNTAYNLDVPTIPNCYAYSPYQSADPEGDMCAHPRAPDRQGAEDGHCQGCEHNEFGTADNGKGKACGNYRLLACYLAADVNLENFDPKDSKAELYVIKVSPTSLKNWANYTQQVANECERSPEGVITRISVEPDKKTRHRINYQEVGIVDFDQTLWDFIEGSGKRAYDQMCTAYQLPTEDEDGDAKPKKGNSLLKVPAAKKPAAKKKATERR